MLHWLSVLSWPGHHFRPFPSSPEGVCNPRIDLGIWNGVLEVGDAGEPATEVAVDAVGKVFAPPLPTFNPQGWGNFFAIRIRGDP